jgi:YidC/Oxa1 family membrane protein insertase
MERFTRLIFIGLAVFLAWRYIPQILNGNKDVVQPIGVGATETAVYNVSTEAPQKCELKGNHFTAQFSTRGAALVDLMLTGDPRYTEGGKESELTSVPGSAPDRFALHDDWRALGTTGDNAQVESDVTDWKIAEHDGSSCTFQYEDERVRLTKTFRTGQGPYEIVAQSTIENLSDKNRVHRLGIENTAWRTHHETDSHFGRQSPLTTEVACGLQGGKLVRKSISDFAPKDFEKPEFEKGWFVERGAIEFAANSNSYFAQAIVPLAGPAAPACGLQIEERWYHTQYAEKTKDPAYGAMYRSRLIYPSKELAPHEKSSYEILAYLGPKDRNVLAHAAGGQHQLSELINLGMFAPISKQLVAFLILVHRAIGNWGIAIVVLTFCVRLVLFPLTWKQIKSMISMRQLKPEIDEINRKFKDDPQQKQLATMEVYRKNGVNPLKGCLPVLVQMPVWWALYSVLQTAVELYHTPFLWFPDLSAPDKLYVLPIVIGATSFVQQKLMPQQGDPQQQKMMLYMMPAVFTVMMLFLPAGLGIYMLTNSVLGIAQQQAVEYFAPKGPKGPKGPGNGIEVREIKPDEERAGKKGREQRKISSSMPAQLKGGS